MKGGRGDGEKGRMKGGKWEKREKGNLILRLPDSKQESRGPKTVDIKLPLQVREGRYLKNDPSGR